MASIIELVKPLVLAFINSRQVKELVVELIDRYVKYTDNDIDDLVAKTVRAALLK